MPWTAPIVGYSDNLGYLRCSECAEERHRDRAITGESWFGADDVCETCGWQFEHIATKDYVHVSFGDVAPDYKKPVAQVVAESAVEPVRVLPRGKRTHYWPDNEAARRNAGYGFGS